MTLLTLVKYLLGDRTAILRLAGSRPALLLGLIFVLAAGFAREYDGEDLLRQPWHLLIPLGASLVTSALLYLLVRIIAWEHSAKEPALFPGYLDFLGLYWLTAPLALVYAIPVERFSSPGDAVAANLWMLALVALWRVLLMARVVSVLYRANYFAALFVVLLFGDTVALAILRLTPLPIVAIMGGIRLSESESLLSGISFLVGFFGIVSWPIWFIGTLVVALRPEPRWEYQPPNVPPAEPVARHLWAIAAVTLLVWIPILPFTQHEQQLRSRVERDLRGGRIRAGLATLSAHERGDFPPHWDPPPRVAYREKLPDIVAVQEELLTLPAQPWVRAIYDEKYSNWLRGENDYQGMLAILSPSELEIHIRLIEHMANRQEVIGEHKYALRQRIDDGDLPPDLSARISNMLREVEPETDENPSAAPTEQPEATAEEAES
ncbi:MAG: hypothetical protein WD872_03430 [Pirellulaceae bacterium]